jgi:hypothetical protein
MTLDHLIMVNTFQFTRTTKLAWRFPKYAKYAKGKGIEPRALAQVG